MVPDVSASPLNGLANFADSPLRDPKAVTLRAVAEPHLHPRAGPGLRRRVTGRGRVAARWALQQAETTWLTLLSAMSLLAMVGQAAFSDWWPLTAYAIPIVLSMGVLSISYMVVLFGVVGFCMVVSVAQVSDLTDLRLAAVGVVVILAAIVLWQARNRERLGVASTRGESMLIDLRDRLAAQSRLPELPPDWHTEAVMRSAGGASFAGDFIVAAKTQRGCRLELLVVDVSGKGVNAGTRALLLSGAFGGLLGSLPPARFLPAANEYLLRQEWGEGFATAVHVAVDLTSGDFELRTAGHPPAVQLHAGSGRWSVHWTEGPVLGVLDDADYTVHQGQLHPGDVLLMYTDGLVETPTRDITYGIDKLVGEADRLVKDGFTDGASRLVSSIDSESDDRALLLLHRRERRAAPRSPQRV